MSSKMLGRWIAVAAGAVAVVAGVYLLRAQRTLERTIEPVEVATPDLYPPDTLLFCAVHGLDDAYDTADLWWKRIEPTALFHAVRTAWDENRDTLPPQVRDAVRDIETGLDEAEARLGHRPTTRAFFETYGRSTAFGLVPAPGDGPAGILAVIKLPDDGAMALLEERLGAVERVRRHDPPDVAGYPVFEEDGGLSGQVLYCVAGGHLFVADRFDALEAAVGRLDAGRDGPDPSDPDTLSGVPEFVAGVPGDWSQVKVAAFVRTGQRFAAWNPELSVLDDYLGKAVEVAGDTKALATSVTAGDGGAGYSLHTSFARDSAPSRSWEEVLPSTIAQVTIQVAGTPGPDHPSVLAVKEFREKPIWRELGALIDDTDALERLVEEALPPGRRPDRATLERLKHDARLVEAIWTDVVEPGVTAPQPSMMHAAVKYLSNPFQAQQAVGVEMDPVSSLLLEAALELLDERFSGVLVREESSDTRAWVFDVEGFARHVMDSTEALSASTRAQVTALVPAVLFLPGKVVGVMGEDLFRDVRSATDGSPGVVTLADDPTFQEAVAGVPPGYLSITYSGSYYDGSDLVDDFDERFEHLLAARGGTELPDEAVQAIRGLMAAGSRALSWSTRYRAQIEAEYANAEQPVVRRVLIDPDVDPKMPDVSGAPAPMSCLDVLPAETFALVCGQIALKEAFAEMGDAFFEEYPDGRTQVDDLFQGLDADQLGLKDDLTYLLTEIAGETGIAVAVPVIEPGGGLGPQGLVNRAPEFICFAEYPSPDRAYGAMRNVLAKLHEILNPESFDVRTAAYRSGEGPPPVGSLATDLDEDGRRAFVLDVFVTLPDSPEPLQTAIGVAERDGVLYVTNSVRTLRRLLYGNSPELGDTLAQTLPDGVLPDEMLDLTVLRSDGVVDWVRLYADPMLPAMLRFSLGGYEERPPQERVDAHLAGWRRALDLLDGLFRTGTWRMSYTVRKGDRLETDVRRVHVADK